MNNPGSMVLSRAYQAALRLDKPLIANIDTTVDPNKRHYAMMIIKHENTKNFMNTVLHTFYRHCLCERRR